MYILVFFYIRENQNHISYALYYIVFSNAEKFCTKQLFWKNDRQKKNIKNFGNRAIE
jgi:hypothetical protein